MRQGLLNQANRSQAQAFAQDNAARQAAKSQYDRLATSVRSQNAQLVNRYNDDMVQMQNQKELLRGQAQSQAAQNIGTFAQDYIQNVLSPQYTMQVLGQARPYSTNSLADMTDAVDRYTKIGR